MRLRQLHCTNSALPPPPPPPKLNFLSSTFQVKAEVSRKEHGQDMSERSAAPASLSKEVQQVLTAPNGPTETEPQTAVEPTTELAAQGPMALEPQKPHEDEAARRAPASAGTWAGAAETATVVAELEDGDAKKRRRWQKPKEVQADKAGAVDVAGRDEEGLAAQPGERPPDSEPPGDQHASSHAPQPNIALAPQVEPAREQGRKQDEAEAEGQTAVGVAGPRRSSAGAGHDQYLAVGASSPPVPDGVQSAQPAQAEQLAQATQHPRPEQKAQREQTEPPKQTEQTEQTEPTEPTEQTGQTGQTAQPLPEQTAEARVRKTWLMSLMSGISRRIFARASLSCRKFRGPWSPRLWSLRLWSPRRHSRRSWTRFRCNGGLA